MSFRHARPPKDVADDIAALIEHLGLEKPDSGRVLLVRPNGLFGERER